MLLKMVAGTEIIDSVPVNYHKMMEEGYLEGLKIFLQEKNNYIFLNAKEEIVFFVEGVPSKMNHWKNK